MADAVIDALEGMEVTEEMRDACAIYPEVINGETVQDIWRAMVGAMRGE